MSDADLKQLMLAPAQGGASLSLAVAESLTCGHLQARIGAISGASTFFLGGITTYTLEQKVARLGVPRALAESVNCVSEQVAIAMAQGALALFGADIAATTTGYAEPASAQGVTQPFAWIALARRQRDGKIRTHAQRIECPGLARVAVQERVTDAAFHALMKFLRS